MSIHLTNLLLIALFFVLAFGIDLLLEAVGGARFLTSQTIIALCCGVISGWVGLGIVQETLPIWGIAHGVGLLALSIAIIIAVVIRNFRAAGPLTAVAGTALQFGIAYFAGPTMIGISILILIAITTHFLRLFSPAGSVVPIINGRPTK